MQFNKVFLLKKEERNFCNFSLFSFSEMSKTQGSETNFLFSFQFLLMERTNEYHLEQKITIFQKLPDKTKKLTRNETSFFPRGLKNKNEQNILFPFFKETNFGKLGNHFKHPISLTN